MSKKAAKPILLIITVSLVAIAVVTAYAAPLQQQVTCSEDYVVQQSDWLSQIAERFYGDPLAYPAIVEATNAAAAAGGAYGAITDPNVLEVGQVLCIPSPEDAQKMLAGSQVTVTGQATTAAEAATEVAVATVVPTQAAATATPVATATQAATATPAATATEAATATPTATATEAATATSIATATEAATATPAAMATEATTQQSEIVVEVAPGTTPTIAIQRLPIGQVGSNFDLTRFIQALQNARLQKPLQLGVPYTIFIPTRDAFLALPQQELNDLLNDPVKFGNLLLNHMLEGKLKVADLDKLDSITTIYGETLPITSSGGVTKIDGATIVVKDFEFGSFTIQGIDAVLVPAGEGTVK